MRAPVNDNAGNGAAQAPAASATDFTRADNAASASNAGTAFIHASNAGTACIPGDSAGNTATCFSANLQEVWQ